VCGVSSVKSLLVNQERMKPSGWVIDWNRCFETLITFGASACVLYSCAPTRGARAGARTDIFGSCEERTSRVSSRLSSVRGASSEDGRWCREVVVGHAGISDTRWPALSALTSGLTATDGPVDYTAPRQKLVHRTVCAIVTDNDNDVFVQMN